jgi:hypothetical protein
MNFKGLKFEIYLEWKLEVVKSGMIIKDKCS